LDQQDLENPYDNFCGWLRLFMHARSKLTESGNVSFYSQSTVEVAQRALRESSEDSNDEREMTPSPRPCKPRSNKALFVVFLVR
jgi:hypothetical protein